MVLRLCLVLLLAFGLSPVQAQSDPAPRYQDRDLEESLGHELSYLLSNPDLAPARLDAKQAQELVQAGQWDELVGLAQAALKAGAAPDHPLWPVWMLLSKAHANRPYEYEWQYSSNLYYAAMAAYGALSSAATGPQRAAALGALAWAERERGNFTQAETALRVSLALDPQPATEEALAALLRDHPFAPAALTADADRDHPALCLRFTRSLHPTSALAYTDFVRIEPPLDTVARVEGETLCLEGARHGGHYTVTVLPGLTSAPGSRTEGVASDSLTVPDRTPSVGFRGSAYVLPRVGSLGLPVVTVNRESVDLTLLRLTDRNLVEEINRQRFAQPLETYELNTLLRERAEVVWSGTLETPGTANRETVTAFPIADVLPERPEPGLPEPGLYVLSAETNEDYVTATQWVVVSDLGLLTYRGDDGLAVVASSLETGQPLAGVTLSLYSRSNRLLGTVETDSQGLGRFAPGLLRGAFTAQPVALTAQTAGGDYTLLDLTRPAFDLSDRGVGGRDYPGPVDAFLYTERGIYRPGETVFLTSLLRSPDGRAVADLPTTLRLFRPDGVEARRIALAASADGAGTVEIPINAAAPTGRWTLNAHLDPEAAPIGQVSFQVEDFVPPTIGFDLAPPAGQPVTTAAALEIPLAARFLYGAPAAGLRGEAEVVVAPTATPFPHRPDLSGYRFGLVEEDWLPQRRPLPLPPTDEAGATTLPLTLPSLPETSLPLEARLRATLFEDGGRAVNRRIVLPIQGSRPLIGLRPLFEEGQVSLGAEATVDILALSPGGEPLPPTALTWTLYEEVYSYIWYRQGGQWSYRVSQQDRQVDTGSLTTHGATPLPFSLRREWGNYRLEVADPASRAVTSLRFAVGWSASPVASATPDKMSITLDRDRYRPGETAQVRLEAPFAGEVVIAVLNNGLRALHRVTVPQEGATIPLEVGDWEAGAYLTATALRPADAASERGPARAIGLTWLSLDRSDRTLAVEIETPERITPRQTLMVPVAVSGSSGPARLTLAAVDEAVLQITNYQRPDPAAHVYGKRRLAVELRDLYGHLIDGRLGSPGALRSGGDISSDALAGLGKRSSRIVSLYSGLVDLDAQGRATVPLEIPDFNGRLRVMAVAFDAAATGSGETSLIVRDPVVADLSLPRFLAPGDQAEVRISLSPLDAPAGAYRLRLSGDGTVVTAEGEAELSLEPGQRGFATVPLTATAVGDGGVSLEIVGPGGLSITRQWDMPVRPAAPFQTRQSVQSLAPGQSLTVTEALFDGLLPLGRQASVTLSALPLGDIAGLLHSLDRYPYGCLEQTVSRALPLLYLAETAARIGAAPDEAAALQERLTRAIHTVLAMQRPDGSFGLWSALGETDPWLSAYALDFLTQAQARGLVVDRFAYAQGLNWLRLSVASGDFQVRELPARSYAHAVLAAARVADAATLRHFADTYLDQIPTRLGKAQIGAALAHFGDSARADRAFQAALAHREGAAEETAALRHATYGTPVRDQAGLLTLAMQAGQPWESSAEIARQMVATWQQTPWLSTQDMAWLLLASHHLLERGGDMAVSLAGQRQETRAGLLTHRLDPVGLTAGEAVTILNEGREPLTLTLSTAGFPDPAPPAVSQGFTLTREVFHRDGTPASLSTVRQNDLFVVLLQGEMTDHSAPQRRALLVDLLPAGFELENAVLGGAEVEDLEWLPEVSEAAHVALRDDRFLAQIDLTADSPSFVAAYVLRATTPGTYTLPGPFIEDMYAPAVLARGASARSMVESAVIEDR